MSKSSSMTTNHPLWLSLDSNTKILEATLNTFRPQNSFNKLLSFKPPLSCNLFFLSFIFCDLLLSESFAIVFYPICYCYLLFVILKCVINLNLYVKCYGRGVAMYFHAPCSIFS